MTNDTRTPEQPPRLGRRPAWLAEDERSLRRQLAHLRTDHAWLVNHRRRGVVTWDDLSETSAAIHATQVRIRRTVLAIRRARAR